jgi:RHS repeat-associated protein
VSALRSETAALGADDPTDSTTSVTTRGFTGQEELTVSGLVHLNGRVYDPTFGRMTSADPTVPDPLDPQAWNRYSYVGNDPLTFTDPSGFSWLSNFFNDVSTFFRAVLANPIVRAVVQIAIAAILAAAGQFEVGAVILSAAASAAIVTGLSGGNLSQMIRAAVTGGVTAAAFFAVGSLAPISGPGAPTFGTLEFAEKFAENIAGHAAVGCMSSVVSGGECGPGALSGAAGAGVSPVALQAGLIAGTTISGLVGGLASIAGGGKFENGAVTAAFGYLFNATAHAGGSLELPGILTNAFATVYQWFTGDTSYVQGNGGGAGIVWQYPGMSDLAKGNWVPLDIGVYWQVSTPLASAESLEVSLTGEVGEGLGTIHGTFDNMSFAYGFMAGDWGDSATLSQDANGNLYLSGGTFKVGAGVGVSASASYTQAYIIRDLINHWFAN